MASRRCVATTISQIAATTNSKGLSTVEALLLSNGEELKCMNMICENVGDSCLCKLSLCLDRLPNLKLLDISYNNLSFLPNNIWNATQLLHLDLSGNRFNSLPKDIIRLSNLQVLRLNYNRLEGLPKVIDELKSLRELQIIGNNLAIKEFLSLETEKHYKIIY